MNVGDSPFVTGGDAVVRGTCQLCKIGCPRPSVIGFCSEKDLLIVDGAGAICWYVVNGCGRGGFG